jgi:hypothetical protein
MRSRFTPSQQSVRRANDNLRRPTKLLFELPGRATVPRCSMRAPRLRGGDYSIMRCQESDVRSILPNAQTFRGDCQLDFCPFTVVFEISSPVGFRKSNQDNDLRM